MLWNLLVFVTRTQKQIPTLQTVFKQITLISPQKPVVAVTVGNRAPASQPTNAQRLHTRLRMSIYFVKILLWMYLS
jgi:hypothetical protein